MQCAWCCVGRRVHGLGCTVAMCRVQGAESMVWAGVQEVNEANACERGGRTEQEEGDVFNARFHRRMRRIVAPHLESDPRAPGRPSRVNDRWRGRKSRARGLPRYRPEHPCSPAPRCVVCSSPYRVLTQIPRAPRSPLGCWMFRLPALARSSAGARRFLESDPLVPPSELGAGFRVAEEQSLRVRTIVLRRRCSMAMAGLPNGYRPRRARHVFFKGPKRKERPRDTAGKR